MIFNSYNRALIFDDEKEKIFPIVQLFDKLLIPNLFIDFSTSLVELSEDKKLKNIRIIFTDFIKGDLSGSGKSQLTHIINAIDSIISKENGPLIVVAWSSHTMQFLKDFKSELKEAGYIFETIVLDKDNYLNGSNIESMIEDIEEKLAKNMSLLKFFDWENQVKVSASKIIEPFASLKESNRKKIIQKLSKASLGSVYDSNENNLNKGLFTTLTTLLSDEMENNIIVDKEDNHLGDENSLVDNVAYINTKLMIDKSVVSNDDNYPGNVYDYDDFIEICSSDNSTLHEICGFDIEDLKNDIFKRDSLSTIKTDDLKMIAVEISPYCDHAQKNMKKAKLITGLILNEELKAKAKSRADFIYSSNRFFLLNNTNEYIYLSFRHVLRINPDFINGLRPIFRIRKEMVNEIQHQVSFYLSRPGLTTLYES